MRRGKTAGHKVKWAERVGPAREKLSRCERAVSGRAQERGAELACRVSGRAVSGRALRKKSSRAAGKKTAGLKLSGRSVWGQPGKNYRAARVPCRAARKSAKPSQRAVSGRGQRACRFGPRARISKTKSPDVRAKNITAWYKAKWAECVESAGEKLSCRGRAVLGRALG